MNNENPSELQQLSALQVALLRALWQLGEGTVSQVQAILASEERDLAPTTVATLLTRLEKRGVVSHRSEGRQFVYRALVDEDFVRRSQVEDLTERVFEGSVSELVNHLLSGDNVKAGDLDRVKQLIEARQNSLRKGN